MKKRNLTKIIVSKFLIAISLAYVSNLEEETNERRIEKMHQLQSWLRREGLMDYLEVEEGLYISNLNTNSTTDYSWCEEQAGVLGWALGHQINIRDYKSQFQFNSEEIFDVFKFLSDGAVGKLMETSHLVDKKIINEGRNFYLYLLKSAGGDLTKYAKSTLRNDSARFFNFCEIDSDYEILGISLNNDRRANEITSIAMERYRAFDWLVSVM